MTLFRSLLVASLVLLSTLPARADDLADEADLEFQLGAEAFQKRDYRAALEHFLLSNRLVPNQNVLFNVAYTYEQLKLYPDAYRWFTQALSQEKDPAQRQQIEAALKRVEPYVAVLEVVTDPPGATLYVDRKDLGPRGNSPRVLAFKPGTYKVLAELEGYESRWSEPVVAKQGSHTKVSLSLKRILGRLSFTGAPEGAGVRLDGLAVCALPCERQASPGRHQVEIVAPGYHAATFTPEVVAEQTTTVTANLEVVRGALVVDSDQRGAAVEIDGNLAGFAPVVLTPPVGERRVRVSRYGFHPAERVVQVSAEGQVRLDVELIPVEEVSAASHTSESLDEAPSSVTIVSSEELRDMSYPTLAEALRGVRGVFLNDDRTYTSVGMRGFGPAGSYGNRVLVLLDGHITNDNWINSSYTGYDARSSLFDVERIEVVRGPGSVLYGTGAFTGVINMVTRDRHSPDRVEAGLAGYSADGTQVAHASALHHWGEAGVSADAAAAYSTGRDFYFPEVAADGRDGNARDADGFKSVSGGLKAWYRAFTLQAHYSLRDKSAPTGEYETFVGDGRTRFVDGRGFAELRFEPKFNDTVQLFSRVYVDRYTYDSYLFGEDDAGGEREETYRGAWAGAEARVALTPLSTVRLELGGEGQYHFQTHQTGDEYVGQPDRQSYLNQSNPFEVGAVYGTADLHPIERLHISLAARLDAYSTFGSSLNPRVAVIGRPYDQGTLKLMVGRAFRAPSIYELYYNDGGLTQVAACGSTCSLRPETVTSGEIEFTHHFTEAWSLTGSLYANDINDLIVLRSSAANENVSQYQNTQVPVLTLGAEAELRREWRQGWMLALAYAYQHSRYLQDATTPDDQRLRQVPNSPEHIASVRAGLPLVGRALRAFTRVTGETGRYDVHDAPGDPPQLRTDPSLLWDVGVAGDLPEWHLSYSVGFYNLANSRYTVPVSTEFAPITQVEQNGRTLFASVTAGF